MNEMKAFGGHLIHPSSRATWNQKQMSCNGQEEARLVDFARDLNSPYEPFHRQTSPKARTN